MKTQIAKWGRTSEIFRAVPFVATRKAASNASEALAPPIGLAVCALVAVLDLTACRENDCSSLDDCDPPECQVVDGKNLDSDSPDEIRVAGCTRLEGETDLESWARAPNGDCWQFPSSLIPDTFEPVPLNCAGD